MEKKCIYCGKESGEKIYHEECLTKQMEEEALRREKKVAEREKEREIKHKTVLTDRENLEEFVKKSFKIDYVPLTIQRQIDSFTKTKGYTCNGIRMTLDYFYNVKDNEPDLNFATIGIVPFVYDEAKAYFEKLNAAITANKSYKKEEQVVQVIEVPKNKAEQTRRMTRRKTIKLEDTYE